MQTSNPNSPWSILVPLTAIVAADKLWDELLAGDLGVFSAATNKSVVVATVAANPDVYFAVGGATGLYYKSRTFSRNSMTNYSVGCYKAPVSKIIELSAACFDCETTYLFNFDIRSISNLNWKGMSTDSVSYSVTTGCCEECDTCPTGNCVSGLKSFMDQINDDERNIFTATMYAGADAGDLNAVALTEEQIEALALTTGDVGFVCPAIRFTASPELFEAYCNEPIQLPDMLDFSFSFVSENCCGVITTLQELVIERGSGQEWAAKAVKAAMYNGSGTWIQNSQGEPNRIKIQVDATKNYTVVAISGKTNSEGGREAFNNPHDLVLLVECDDTATRDSLVTYLDSFCSLVGLPAQTTAANLCDCDE